MFYDKVLRKTSKPGEKINKLVLKTRHRTYYQEVYNEETRLWDTVVAGEGSEIVKEINVTQEGLEAWNSLSPEEQESLVKDL